MSSPYEIIIGLEVHAQLRTESKLFCGCSTAFGSSPNTQTCPVCLGQPGVLPVLNKKAFEMSLKTGLALGCRISEHTKFDRKHYYYPDLPKNIQISQYDMPFALGGEVRFTLNGEPSSVRLIRIHLEEDAGKLVHDDLRDISHVDLNRTGTPLMEIVSEPDITSPEQAYEYLNTLRLILRYLEVSDCNMQEGSLRCDANINLKIGDDYTPISEVKNLNSFRGVEAAMKYEAERQYREYRKTGKTKHDTPKVTVGWDAEKCLTVVQRSKEEAHDYRYFPEPDIPPINVTEDWLAGIRSGIGELPLDRKARFEKEYGLSDYDAGVLIQDKYIADYFEKTAAASGSAKDSANYIINDIMRELNERNVLIQELSVTPGNLASLISLVQDGVINKNVAKETVLPEMLSSGTDPAVIVKEKGLEQISDAGELDSLIEKIIADNPAAVDDYKKGKKQAIGFFIGQVMRETKGQADHKVVSELLTRHLGNA